VIEIKLEKFIISLFFNVDIHPIVARTNHTRLLLVCVSVPKENRHLIT